VTAPVVLATGTVTWRILSTAADGPDAGTAPDQVGGGHVTFVPASRHLPVSGATVFITNKVHTVDAAGVLAPVTLEAGTWTAHYRGPAGDLLLSVPFTLAAGQTVDLADSVPAAVVNGVALAKGDRGPHRSPQGPAGPDRSHRLRGSHRPTGADRPHRADRTAGSHRGRRRRLGGRPGAGAVRPGDRPQRRVRRPR
jgi:hypothetical protein